MHGILHRAVFIQGGCNLMIVGRKSLVKLAKSHVGLLKVLVRTSYIKFLNDNEWQLYSLFLAIGRDCITPH